MKEPWRIKDLRQSVQSFKERVGESDQASMVLTSVAVAICCFIFSHWVHLEGIRLAHRFQLLDHPSPRRRHRSPTPIVGGLGIFLTWFLGMSLFGVLQPEWMRLHFASILPISVGLGILLVLGICDDVFGLNPRPKLGFQLLAAAIVIAFEPNLHSVCLAWQVGIGLLIWPLAAIWIVGITNAVNLIDGLDGLAGGTAFLVSVSIGVLSFVSSSGSAFQSVSMIVLAGCILGFLRFNWSPARIFLGDNGSLPLGFMIAINSLTCHPPSRSWVMVASIILMLGYPILDMGLAVLRRYRNRLPLFKADRNHLHFRVQRLGLSSHQTSVFLLTIGLYLQLAALCLNFLPPAVVGIAIFLVAFSIFSLLYMVRCIELSRVNRLANFTRPRDTRPLQMLSRAKPQGTITVDILLGPIFEVGLSEERSRCHELIGSLELMLNITRARNEAIEVRGDLIRIELNMSQPESGFMTEKQLRLKYSQKLSDFCSMMDLQCSLSTIPFKVNIAS